jgi:hypothetical protein
MKLHKNPLELLDELQETLDIQWDRLRCKERIERLLRQLRHDLNPNKLSTSISFMETSMNPTAAGETQVFAGSLAPTGSVLASDAVATITSNDPSVSPTLDSTQLIVSVTYPAGWVESTTTPLAFAYATTSASTGQALSATITPSAPPNPLATAVSFAQTT